MHRQRVCSLLFIVQAVVLTQIVPPVAGTSAHSHPRDDSVSASAEEPRRPGDDAKTTEATLRNSTLRARLAILDATMLMRLHALARSQTTAGKSIASTPSQDDLTQSPAVSALMAAVAADPSSAAAWEALADAHAMSGYVL